MPRQKNSFLSTNRQLAAGLLVAWAAAACAAPQTPGPGAPTPFDPGVTLPAQPATENAPAPDSSTATGCATVETLASAGGVDVSGWTAYCDDYYRFGFKYPPGGPPTPPIESRAILYLPIAPGTTLVEKYLVVEPVEGDPDCSSTLAQGVPPDAIQTEQTSINGLSFKKQTGGGVATGNIYDWVAYSTTQNNACVSLSFTLHYTDAANYASPPAEFDRAAESAVFEQIVATFTWLP